MFPEIAQMGKCTRRWREKEGRLHGAVVVDRRLVLSALALRASRSSLTPTCRGPGQRPNLGLANVGVHVTVRLHMRGPRQTSAEPRHHLPDPADYRCRTISQNRSSDLRRVLVKVRAGLEELSAGNV